VQREKGRRGSMASIDAKLAAKEKSSADKQEQMLARQKRMEDLKKMQNETAILLSNTSSSEETDEEAHNCQASKANDDETYGACTSRTQISAKRKRG